MKAFDGTITVFVYGTLLPNEANHSVIMKYIRRRMRGIVKGYLYNVGAYPALVLSDEGMDIEGEWLTLDEDALPVLDELEDYYGPDQVNEYERVWIRDAYSKEEGWVYVYPHSRGYPLMKEGSWKRR